MIASLDFLFPAFNSGLHFTTFARYSPSGPLYGLLPPPFSPPRPFEASPIHASRAFT